MARAAFKVKINIGLMNISVGAFKTASEKESSFKTFKNDGTEVMQVYHEKTPDGPGNIVPRDKLVKGYEDTSGLVLLTESEVSSINAQKKDTLEIIQFVDSSLIPSEQIQEIYFLNSEKTSKDKFDVLIKTLEKSGLTGIGKHVFGSKERIVIISAKDNKLILSKLYYPEELRAFEGDVPGECSEENLKLCNSIVSKMTRKRISWDKLVDTYPERLDKLIQEKKMQKKSRKVS